MPVDSWIYLENVNQYFETVRLDPVHFGELVKVNGESGNWKGLRKELVKVKVWTWRPRLWAPESESGSRVSLWNWTSESVSLKASGMSFWKWNERVWTWRLWWASESKSGSRVSLWKWKWNERVLTEGLSELVKLKMEVQWASESKSGGRECEPEGFGSEVVKVRVWTWRPLWVLESESANLKASVSLFVPSSSLVAPLKLDAPKLDSRRARKRLRT